MVRNKIANISFALLVVVAVLISGCDFGANSGKGTLEVRLHDNPGDFDEVNVFVDRVEVNNAEDDTGWVVINEPNQSYDLLKLSNGAYEVLGTAELDAGLYNQIRLILSPGKSNVVVDSVEHDLFTPSGTQTGVKLNIHAEINEGIEYILLLDFDAERSVVKTGNGEYLLKPVIRATNKAITGNISGTISPADAEPAVYAISGMDTLSSVYADTVDGYFQLVGLTEGMYDVFIEPRNEAYSDTTISDVSVTLGETNDLGTIELN